MCLWSEHLAHQNRVTQIAQSTPLLSHRLVHIIRIKGGRDAGGTTGTEKEGRISTTRLLPQSDLSFLSFTMIPACVPRFLRRLMNQHAQPGEPHNIKR
ncbi:uncharacterized [Tachysurus ichikawai]